MKIRMSKITVASLAVLFLIGVTLSGPVAFAGKGSCGGGRGHGHGHGHGHGRGGGGMQEARDSIHYLLEHHQQIERKVEMLKMGVVTVTTSENPEIAEMIRHHVRQMEQRLESGHGMRHWDPLFVEIFKHADKIEMKIVDVPGGVRVRETSDDPKVADLIRAHAAQGVSEFVERGFDRAHEASPLPAGYHESAQDRGAM